MAKPNYYSGGPSYNSYKRIPYGARIVPLQSPYKLHAYNSPTFVSNNNIPPVTNQPKAPAISQWAPPNPTIPEAPAASPWIQPPPQETEAPAVSQWVPPNPAMPQDPAASQWMQPPPQQTEAPAVSEWTPPNPTIPEVPAAIPSASQELTPIGALPVDPSSSPMSLPPPSVFAPVVDVPAISPQPENTPAPSQPLPPPPVVQPDSISQASVIFSPVQDSASPPVQGPAQDSWPETPRVVPAADNIPALPPATFGQFAVQPAR